MNFKVFAVPKEQSEHFVTRGRYELVFQALAQQTKLLLNGVTSRLEPVEMRRNASLQAGNVNRQFPRGLSCWNSSAATVSHQLQSCWLDTFIWNQWSLFCLLNHKIIVHVCRSDLLCASHVQRVSIRQHLNPEEIFVIAYAYVIAMWAMIVLLLHHY